MNCIQIKKKKKVYIHRSNAQNKCVLQVILICDGKAKFPKGYSTPF